MKHFEDNKNETEKNISEQTDTLPKINGVKIDFEKGVITLQIAKHKEEEKDN
jgi:hypothetical protein